MPRDRSNAGARGRLMAEGHDVYCAESLPRPTLGPMTFQCPGCYAWGQGEARPRTMEAAYLAVPAKGRALMVRDYARRERERAADILHAVAMVGAPRDTRIGDALDGLGRLREDIERALARAPS